MNKIMKGFTLLALAITTACCVCFSIVFAETDSTKVESIVAKINFAEYDENNLPIGKVGRTYRVFDSVSTDENGNAAGEINVFVFNPENTLLPINGGKFRTETAGEYRIEYIAKYRDLSDKKIVTVMVDDIETPLSYIENEANESSAETGSVVFVYNGTYAGGVGTINVSKSIFFAEEEIAFSSVEDAVYFKPEKNGEYVVTTTLNDFVGQTASFTERVTVEDSFYPVLGEPSLTKTCVAGTEKSLPAVDGIVYENGDVFYMPVKVYFDNADISETMKFTATAGEHEIKYVCENLHNNAYKTEKIYKITAIENTDGELIFDRYFYFENFESVSDEESSSYVIKALAANGARTSFSFDSAIPVKYLDLGLTVNTTPKAYSNIKIRFTDSKNAGDAVEINLGKLENGENFYALFDAENNTVVNEKGEVIAKVDRFSDGRLFNGFKSGRAYISLAVEELNRDIEIALATIAGNSVTTATYDGGRPRFIDSDKMKSAVVAYYGKKVTLPELSAYDLFDANPVVTLQVIAPDKSIVYDGTAKDGYEFIAESYGNYVVNYFATDAAGNSRKYTATIYVADIIPPVIEVSGIASEVKVGETISIPEMSVTDNVSSQDKILSYVYVYYGNNLTKLVDDSYTFKARGEYKIRFVAYDEYQNYTITEFTVICK